MPVPHPFRGLKKKCAERVGRHRISRSVPRSIRPVIVPAKLDIVRRFVERHSALVLATTDPAGSPRATPLFYCASPSLSLCWFSSARSAHSANCMRSPLNSVAIHSGASDWKQIQGVQMRGLVSRVTDPAARAALAHAFAARFHLGAAPLVALRRSSLFCFVPSWVRYIDNTRRFGYRFELEIPRPSAQPTSQPW